MEDSVHKPACVVHVQHGTACSNELDECVLHDEDGIRWHEWCRYFTE